MRTSELREKFEKWINQYFDDEGDVGRNVSERIGARTAFDLLAPCLEALELCLNRYHLEVSQESVQNILEDALADLHSRLSSSTQGDSSTGVTAKLEDE